MLRGGAPGLGAGPRVLSHVPWFLFVGGRPREGSRAIKMGLAWIINALLTEYVVRARCATRVTARSGRAGPALLSIT